MLWFSRLSSVPKIFRVTKRLANSSVQTIMGIRIIASRFSVTRILTCKGLPSGIQKIVVMKCSPCRESGVHLQRISALKRVLLSPARFRVISIGFIQCSVGFSNRVVHAHNFRWGRVLEKTFDKCKVCRFRRTRKSDFLPSFEFFRVDSVTFKCNVVGSAFDNVDFVVNIEENSCHLKFPVLTPNLDWGWIFEESFDERIM